MVGAMFAPDPSILVMVMVAATLELSETEVTWLPDWPSPEEAKSLEKSILLVTAATQFPLTSS